MEELPDLTLVSKALKVVYENSVAAKVREIARLKDKLANLQSKLDNIPGIDFCNVCGKMMYPYECYVCSSCRGVACSEHGVCCYTMENAVKEFCLNCCEFDEETKRFICPLGHNHLGNLNPTN